MKRKLLQKKSLWRPLRPAVYDPRERRRAFLGKLRSAGLIAAGVIGLCGAAAGYEAVRDSNLFVVARIDVDGLHHITRDEIVSLLEIEPSATMWDVDLESLRDRLLSHPWVKAAHIRKNLPDALAVVITEREPAAVVAEGGKRVLVDDSGRVLSDLDAAAGTETGAVGDWPTFTGIRLDSLRKDEARARDALVDGMNLLKVVQKGDAPGPGPSRPDPIKVDLSRPSDIVLDWNGYRVLLGEGADGTAWRRLQRVYNDIHERKKHAREIDLRFPNQVIVR